MEKSIKISLETLMKIESAINAGSSIIDNTNEIYDLLSDASHTVGALITDHFTPDEIDDAQNN